MIFPKVEYWLNVFHKNKEQAIGKGKGKGKEEVIQAEEDNAGLNFLILLQELRNVFPQDSVVLKRKYLLYYLWQAPIFAATLFKDFESRLLQPKSPNGITRNECLRESWFRYDFPLFSR
ncbi:hypothetical protein K501DRAFT_266814 [Backusella circina FSU 941]|nr:hypothetical protein K501DRAFT_266814 [Backusella circina FSU 941]